MSIFVTAALTFSLAAGTSEPAWVEDWLAWPLPDDSEEGEMQRALRQREHPDSWATDGAVPVTIHILDADTGKPIANALLLSWQDRQVAFTDATGTASPKLWYSDPEGSYVASVAPGYQAGADHVPVVDGHLYVALRKAKSARVRGVVIRGDGLPAKGARVGAVPVREDDDVSARGARIGPVIFKGTAHRVLGAFRGSGSSVATDTDGHFALIVPAGAQKVVASIPNVGYAESSGALKGPLRLGLAPTGGVEVAGIVVDTTGQAIRGIEIQDEYSDARVVTGPDGRFHFNRCAPGLFYFDVDGAESIYEGASAYAGKDLGKLTVVVDPGKKKHR